MSYHHFVDDEYDTWHIDMFGQSFVECLRSDITPEQASELRMRMGPLADSANNLVVNGQSARSRSAAVATWIAKRYGFILEQEAP